MSCRVFKREMEFAMFDALVEKCRELGVRKIVGTYIPSKKNSMVAGLNPSLGFTRLDDGSRDRELWHYDVPQSYSARSRYVRKIATTIQAVASA